MKLSYCGVYKFRSTHRKQVCMCKLQLIDHNNNFITHVFMALKKDLIFIEVRNKAIQYQNCRYFSITDLFCLFFFSPDAEVAELTSRPSYLSTPRPRSASPYLYRPSYSTRFGARSPLSTLSAADRLEVELAIERARARARARALVRSRSPSPLRYTPSVWHIIFYFNVTSSFTG